MEIHFITELTFGGLWLWIVDKNNRIFCARVDFHMDVLLLAQGWGVELTEVEVIGGGEFYLIPDYKSVCALGQNSRDFGRAPDEALQALVKYFLAAGWSL